MKTQWDNPHDIKERIIVTGVLKLETPTHLGSGDAEGPLDMPLVQDPLTGNALLMGTSLAGALRNYVVQQLTGGEAKANALFGEVDDKTSKQSWLIIDDGLGETPAVELRDGVAIDACTRTAEDKKKFDIELLEAGTTFPLSFELWVPKKDEKDFEAVLATALQGLQAGDITLGKRKRRGFGKCSASGWRVWRYDMTDTGDLLKWLAGEAPANVKGGNDIAKTLTTPLPTNASSPDCTLEATFGLDGSLLIRSGFGEAKGPDVMHLRSWRPDKQKAVPVLSGTSLAGALRARSQRIAKTLEQDGVAITNDLFGYRPVGKEDADKLTASRIWVEESEIEHGKELVQTRVKIDRFTGGSYPAALFSEEPVFGTADTQLTMRLRIPDAKDKEVGLLLLLLRDLWTGDLPLGGESSVGRGRLKGRSATLAYDGKTWRFAAAPLAEDDMQEQLEVTQTPPPEKGTPYEALQAYVDAFTGKTTEETSDEKTN